MEDTKNKYQLIIDSCINGNWNYNKNIVKYWNNTEKKRLLDEVKSYYPKIYDDILHRVILN